MEGETTNRPANLRGYPAYFLGRAHGLLGRFNRQHEIQEPERQSALLWTTRPPEVTEQIDKYWYSEDHTKPPSRGFMAGYLSEGKPTYKFGSADSISTDGIISSVINNHPVEEAVQLLDVGTGDGQLLTHLQKEHPGRVIVHGLTAHDYGASSNRLRGVDYRIGDANHLMNIYEPNSFDVIVSNLTLIHLMDPLGTIAQMYEALKPNGVMAVDRFMVKGLEDSFPSIVEYLNQQGYAVVAEYNYRLTDDNQMRLKDCNALLLRKTHDHLYLPVEYSELDRTEVNVRPKVQYGLSLPLPAKRFSLPDKLVRARQGISSLYPDVQDLEPYERRLLHLYIEGRLPIERWGESAKEYWGDAMDHIATPENFVERYIKRKEINQDLIEGIAQWIKEYRNQGRLHQEIKEKLHLKL